MARETNKRDLTPVINAVKKWIDDCLIGDGSIFSNGQLWTGGNIAEVKKAFVDNPDEGKDTFMTKLKKQMDKTSPSAKQLMAEMLWALLMFPTNINQSTKRVQIREIWSLTGEILPENHPMLSKELLTGIGSGGQAYNNLRWMELSLLIELAGDLKTRPAADRQNILNDYDGFLNWMKNFSGEKRQFKQMLRYFAFPDRVERMSSNNDRYAILAGFKVASEKETRKWTDKQLDEALLNLRKKLQSEYPNKKLDFYEEPLEQVWDSPLAEPFSVYFSSYDEADWAFDFLKDTLAQLGVTNADDPRVALTLPKQGHCLRLNFCKWVITSFFKVEETNDRAELTLLDGLLNLHKRGTFTTKMNEAAVCIYGLPIEKLRNMDPELRSAFEKSMTHITSRFGKQSKTEYRRSNQPKLMEMVFDKAVRKERLRSGLTLDPEVFGYWIFQANPEYFDVDQYLQAKKEIQWQARQHTDDITTGDKVLIWRAGDNAGVLAECVVTSPPDPTIEEDAPELYRKPFEPGDSAPRCRLHVVEQFVHQPITRNSIKATLPDLNIIRQAAGTNFSVTEGEYAKILSLRNQPMSTEATKLELPAKRNLILYGPPGTGKTYKLRDKYFKLFTDQKAVLNVEERALSLVKDLAWWQVVALTLMDAVENKGSVGQILKHPLVQSKLKLSNNKNLRAMLWASLQAHTKKDCPTVNYTKRMEPLVFSKDEDSIWTIDTQLAENAMPDILESFHSFKNPPKEDELHLRYRFVTFHQSFSYEDFIEGIKPKLEGEADGQIAYEVRDGIFKEICLLAQADHPKPYALFIDEINRGNVASIFGELITLIEDDKRIGQDNPLTVMLPYSREVFGVPDNLYIIGTMNTADRSVEALDTALRRRFIFEEMRPDETKVKQPVGLGVDLPKLFRTINARLERLLDHDHCIGHAYFMDVNSLSELQCVFANKIIPLLREYFYGNPAKIGLVLGKQFITKQTETNDFASGDWGLGDLDEKVVYQFTESSNWKEEDFASIYG